MMNCRVSDKLSTINFCMNPIPCENLCNRMTSKISTQRYENFCSRMSCNGYYHQSKYRGNFVGSAEVNFPCTYGQCVDGCTSGHLLRDWNLPVHGVVSSSEPAEAVAAEETASTAESAAAAVVSGSAAVVPAAAAVVSGSAARLWSTQTLELRWTISKLAGSAWLWKKDEEKI